MNYLQGSLGTEFVLDQISRRAFEPLEAIGITDPKQRKTDSQPEKLISSCSKIAALAAL